MRHARDWTVLVVVAATLWLPTWADAQAAGSARVVLARAPVEVIPRGQAAAQPLARGARLSEGDRVRTGPGGAVEIELGDSSLVRLAELSEIEIDKLDVDAAGAPTTSRFNLGAGKVRAWVARQLVAKVATGQGRLSVQTPTAVAAVRQTDFLVVHTPNPGSRVYTFAGAVETTSAGRASVVCTRNRWTEVVPGRDPEPCRGIALRDKRSLLKALSFQSATVPGPRDLDRDAENALTGKVSDEKLSLGTLGGVPSQNGRAPATGTNEVPVSVIVTTD